MKFQIIPQKYQIKTKELLNDFSSSKTRKKVENIILNKQGESNQLGIYIGGYKIYVIAKDGNLYIKYDVKEAYDAFIKVLNLF